MTYSQKVKNELCEVKMHCDNCLKAMLYGILLFSKGISKNNVQITTENKSTADFIADSLAVEAGVIVTIDTNLYADKRSIYTVSVDYKNDIDKIIYDVLDDTIIKKEHINANFLQNECCKQAFLRGSFLAGGVVVDPETEYHFEFSVPTEELSLDLLNFLEEKKLYYKTVKREKHFVNYTKESNTIEDTLTYLGAFKASLDLMNLKIEKEIRNNANRITNCETANIDKTVSAALKQIKKIKKIKDTIGFDALSPQLKEAAILRFENPDLSLRELTEIYDGKISRSGLNHRLQKLCEISDNIE